MEPRKMEILPTQMSPNSQPVMVNSSPKFKKYGCHGWCPRHTFVPWATTIACGYTGRCWGSQNCSLCWPLIALLWAVDDPTNERTAHCFRRLCFVMNSSTVWSWYDYDCISPVNQTTRFGRPLGQRHFVHLCPQPEELQNKSDDSSFLT